MEVSDSQFDALITRAMDELPQEYLRGLKNVVIVMADAPNAQQQTLLDERGGGVLFGVFEGVPLTQQGNGWSGMLPDKITLFKHALVAISPDEATLFEEIKRTLWHEIAHYYGLDHDHIDALESHS